ncbi:hypothetical protein XU18_3630 [Perkinsela sp. CCAP 1560/4]|nr:hypothetical protein XU18_3630 [Perkinsela sp. CCAP 1560/4]|eukprot:KNH05311.1 hypothetical protein XU18_3630 [Perkinsela sp. CCAP 1560/4]
MVRFQFWGSTPNVAFSKGKITCFYFSRLLFRRVGSRLLHRSKKTSAQNDTLERDFAAGIVTLRRVRKRPLLSISAAIVDECFNRRVLEYWKSSDECGSWVRSQTRKAARH